MKMYKQSSHLISHAVSIRLYKVRQPQQSTIAVQVSIE